MFLLVCFRAGSTKTQGAELEGGVGRQEGKGKGRRNQIKRTNPGNPIKIFKEKMKIFL